MIEKHKLQFFTIKEVSDITTFHPLTIRKAILNKELRALKKLNKWLIEKKDLIEWLNESEN